MNIPQSQVTPALVECRISPPPLLYNIDRNSTPESIIERAVSSAKQEKESTPKKRPWGCSSTLEQSRPSTSKENNKEAFTPERVDNQESTPKKGKWGCTSATKTQKIPSTNLADMHKETLLVLNQINSSIEKMADSQERIAKSQERIANALELLVNRNI
uniref:Uncharacterized protein LOC114335791 n=1 Tax=Diabrotica virgifera virgifera TaxID=50390 RepID=A0A6P7G4E4_DIAVI